jgi:hypothetical protein
MGELLTYLAFIIFILPLAVLAVYGMTYIYIVIISAVIDRLGK